MNHLELLIPFGLPVDMADDLLRQLQAPALASLLGRSNKTVPKHWEAFSRALPHEHHLANALQLRTPDSIDASPAFAATAWQQYEQQADSGTWFLLNPVHMHIARDHLILTDMRQLSMSEEESRALFVTAQELIEEAGRTLHYCTPKTWLMRADAWAGLQTATPDAACGHNVDIWLPKGEAERHWRKLLNEVQMAWHIHPVNAAREARGAAAVNALWLWGAATLDSHDSRLQTNCARLRFFHDANETGPMAQLLPHSPIATAGEALQRFTDKNATVIGLLDDLSGPALASDWGVWLERMQTLEQNWFAPIQSALREGHLDRLSLTLSHSHSLRTFTCTRHSHRKFWKRPSLAGLAP